MLCLFFISTWVSLGFQFNFETIFTLIMQLLLLLNLLATSFYFKSFFFFCFAVTFHFTLNRSFSFVLQSRSILLSVLIYFFFYFSLNLWKIVKFWVAALGHYRRDIPLKIQPGSAQLDLSSTSGCFAVFLKRCPWGSYWISLPFGTRSGREQFL